MEPQDNWLLQSSEVDVLLIDDAAAIPFPIVKDLLFGSINATKFVGSARSNKLAFLSSTITGYEGTGRSFSLKLLKELRQGLHVQKEAFG